MADGKVVNAVTPTQVEAVATFRQVIFMDRFKCSYEEYMETPAEFVNDAVTIIALQNEKQNRKKK